MISELAFGGTWRRYQALALEAFEADRRSGDRRTHILAPPGSGKSRGPPATCAATCAQRLRRRASDSAVPWTRHSPRPDSPGTWFPGWSRVRPTDRSCCSSGCCAGSRRSRAGGSPSPTTSAVPSTGRRRMPAPGNAGSARANSSSPSAATRGGRRWPGRRPWAPTARSVPAGSGSEAWVVLSRPAAAAATRCQAVLRDLASQTAIASRVRPVAQTESAAAAELGR